MVLDAVDRVLTLLHFNFCSCLAPFTTGLILKSCCLVSYIQEQPIYTGRELSSSERILLSNPRSRTKCYGDGVFSITALKLCLFNCISQFSSELFKKTKRNTNIQFLKMRNALQWRALRAQADLHQSGFQWPANQHNSTINFFLHSVCFTLRSQHAFNISYLLLTTASVLKNNSL